MAKAETSNGRQHKATYARDKRTGGYIIRVEGPNAPRFAGRDVPVVRKDSSESVEHLEELIWQGVDQETAKPIALYRFQAKPREDLDDDVTF